MPLRRKPQYFEMFGHRGLWHEGWKAVGFHPSGTPCDGDRWERFHRDRDFSESEDLAAQQPEHVKALVGLCLRMQVGPLVPVPPPAPMHAMVPAWRQGTLLIDGQAAGSIKSQAGFNDFVSWERVGDPPRPRQRRFDAVRGAFRIHR
jgi:hypothetical protein